MKTRCLALAAMLLAGTTAAMAQAPAPAPNAAAPARPNPRTRDGARAVPRVTGEITRAEGRVYTVRSLRGETILVTVPTGTTVMKPNRVAGSVADLKVGVRINAMGERPTPTTLIARRVVIVNPTAMGTIETLSATSLTLRQADGKSATYTVNDKTRWMRNREASPRTNFKVGERVIVEYVDKTATTVRLAPAQRAPGQRGARQRRNAPNAPNAPSTAPGNTAR